MKLRNVDINEFRSVWKSNPFDIGQVTCLVGKNESGKTTTLQALYRLNPIVDQDGTFDVTEDYPRARVEDYEQEIATKKRTPAQVVTATFELEPAEIAEVQKYLGREILTAPTLTLTKGYDNILHYTIPLDEAAGVRSVANMAGLPAEVATEAAALGTFAKLVDFLTQRASALEPLVNEALAKAASIQDSTAKTKAEQDARSLGESVRTKEWRAWADTVQKNGLQQFVWDQYLNKRVPKFLYFDEYYQMLGAVNIQELKQRQATKQLIASDRPMLGLIDLARLNLDQLVSPQRTEFLLNKLEGASNHLSGQILKYWSQNKHIQLRFDVRPAAPQDPPGFQAGTNLLGRVFDAVHQVSTPLGRRSRGFIWFFSFLAWYSQQKKDGTSMILLLDEPGLFLHASAQGDLLRYIEEELKPNHQVVFSTHSPFMIDPKDFSRVRIVEDKSMQSDDILPDDEKGTKVTQDILEVSDATLFPLQGALGYDIAQTLFVGPNSLIVEGVSDLLYLPAMSSALESASRVGLDEKWTITPVGGSDKVATFAALLSGQKRLNVATLIDIQDKDRQSIENIYKRKLLKKSHVLTFADFSGKSEADIEDLFDPAFYLTLVSEAYKKELSGKAIAMSDLPPGGERIVPRVESLFASRKIPFNHYRPARFFAENLGALTAKLSDKVLDGWGKMMASVNSLLKT